MLAAGLADRLWPGTAGPGAGLAVHPVTATAASKPSQPSIRRLAMILRILALNPQLIYRRRNLRVSCADLDTEPGLANGCGSRPAKQLP